MKGKGKIYILLLATILIGCDSGYDCYLENIAHNRIGFYKEGNAEVKYEFPEVLTVSLMVNGKDSIVVNHIQNADALQLPMSYTNTCDTVIFSYGNDIADTIRFFHENILFYQSMECGTIMYHRLDSIRNTSRYIDSIAIVKDYVKFDADENVKIFFID